jgi:hypothetical protein
LDGKEASVEVGQQWLNPSTGVTEFQGFRYRVKPVEDAASGTITLTTTTEICLPSP